MKIFFSSKSVLAKLISSVGIPETTIRNRSGKQYLVLMYHRILPLDQLKPWIQAGMYVHPHTFEMQVKYLKQHLNVISFSELHGIVNNYNPITFTKKPLVIFSLWFFNLIL